MSEKVVSQESVEKALSALKAVAQGEDLSKGGNTVTAKVPAMVGESGATQVFHTPSDSNPGSWAGSTQTDVPGNGAVDGIDANGTDYNGKGMAKSILELVKSGRIAPDVALELLKGFPFAKKDDDKDEKKDEKDEKKDVKKSAADKKDEDEDVEKSLASSAAVSDAFEVSEFLSGFVQGFAKALNGLESRISKRIDDLSNKDSNFKKSLTDSLVAIGEATVQNASRIESVSNQPARGPKSVTVLEKSFGGNSENKELSRNQILKSLEDLNMSGKIHHSAVLQFESTGHITEDTLRKVSAYVAGK